MNFNHQQTMNASSAYQLRIFTFKIEFEPKKNPKRFKLFLKKFGDLSSTVLKLELHGSLAKVVVPKHVCHSN